MLQVDWRKLSRCFPYYLELRFSLQASCKKGDFHCVIHMLEKCLMDAIYMYEGYNYVEEVKIK